MRSYLRTSAAAAGIGVLSAHLSGQIAEREPPSARRALTGTVLLPDGSPAAGAVVVTSAGGQAVTGSDGSFELSVDVPQDASSVEVTAVAPEPGGVGSLSASERFVPSVGPTSSAGRLVLSLSPNCHPRWLPAFGAAPGMDNPVRALAVFDEGTGPALYAGGTFSSAGGVAASRIARWDGSSWSALGSGIGGEYGGYFARVEALAVFDDGGGPALYAGGDFSTAGGAAANRIAKWDGTGWSALGAGVGGGSPTTQFVYALAVFDDGRGPALYAGGDFTTAGGRPASQIARWDGTSWSELGSGMSDTVHALAVYDDGGGDALFAGGQFSAAGGISAYRIAKWNGASWSSLDSGMVEPYSSVRALAVYDDGGGPTLFVGGDFTTVGGVTANGIASWDGSSWRRVGSGTSGDVQALVAYDDGGGTALFVGGGFATAGGVTANGIARWNGSSWTAVGSGTSSGVDALVVYDDGRGPTLAVGGFFASAGGTAANHIAQWDGSSWSELGGDPNPVDGAVNAFATFDDGGGAALYAGGAFVGAGGTTLNGIGMLVGSSWSALGGGVAGSSAEVLALATHDDGSGPALFAGGSFLLAGVASASRIARWDGAVWSALGGGTNGSVEALAVYDDGGGPALYAGGHFSTAGGVSARGIAKWDGSAWSAVGGGMGGSSPSVLALVVHDDGNGPALFAGGEFGTAGGVPANRIARWDGSNWSEVGGGITGPAVRALVVHDDGSGPALFAGGQFVSAGGLPAERVAKWDGSSWHAVAQLSGSSVRALVVHDDGRGPALYAAGEFGKRVAKLQGSTWLGIGSGIDDPVHALASWHDGHGPALFAGGLFDATPAGDAHLAKWGCRPRPLR